MELVKNIFFNTDKLVENSVVKISYTGKLFQDGSDEVFIHYGFGNSWDNLNEIKMEKSELGFQAEIELVPSETLNLCFRNANNEWDNNDGQNYICPIEKQELSLVVKEDVSISNVYIVLSYTFLFPFKSGICPIYSFQYIILITCYI